MLFGAIGTVPKNKIEIRWLTPDDWEIYRNLRLEALTESPSAFGSTYQEQMDYPEKIWKERTTNTLFAFVDGEPAGLIGKVRLPRIKQSHIVNIVGFYVKRKYRGMGIGKLLLDEIMSHIRGLPGVSKVSIGVNTTQIAALRIYQSYGFEIIGTCRREFKEGDTYYDMIMMELLL